MPIEDIRSRSVTRPSTWSDVQRPIILSELDHILNHPSFKASKRCRSLLQYLIQHALNGDIESIKERTLGVEVFGRPADYDTNIDPIVRMTANEIRKRLAQYYHEPGIEHELTFRLNAGTYIPQFDFSATSVKPVAAVPVPEKPPAQPLPINVGKPVVVARKTDDSKTRNRRFLLWASVAVCILALLCVTYVITRPAPTPQEILWAPLLKNDKPIVISVGDLNFFAGDANWHQTLEKIQKIMTTHEIPERKTLPMEMDHSSLPQNMTVFQTDAPLLPYVDANAANKVSIWLTRHKRENSMGVSSEQTYDDFKRGPVVIVGALDNPWYLVLLANLRYRYGFDIDHANMYVADAQNPRNTDIRLPSSKAFYYDASSIDYAIITRYYDNDSGTWIMGISGLSQHGTEAGAELITNPAYNSMIPKELLTGNKNFQIVIKTTIVNGHLGTPNIIAVHSW